MSRVLFFRRNAFWTIFLCERKTNLDELFSPGQKIYSGRTTFPDNFKVVFWTKHFFGQKSLRAKHFFGCFVLRETNVLRRIFFPDETTMCCFFSFGRKQCANFEFGGNTTSSEKIVPPREKRSKILSSRNKQKNKHRPKCWV